MMKNVKASLTDKELVNNLMNSTREIWLAGLGAYGKAQEQGAKVFESLVTTGAQVEARAIKVAGERIEQVVADTTKRWNDLQSAVEARAKRSVAKLNLAGSSDIDALVARIDAVKAQVDALAKKR